jgi:hypothetical protein
MTYDPALYSTESVDVEDNFLSDRALFGSRYGDPAARHINDRAASFSPV